MSLKHVRKTNLALSLVLMHNKGKYKKTALTQRARLDSYTADTDTLYFKDGTKLNEPYSPWKPVKPKSF